MELYGSFTSPYVRHCRIALLETGLNCQFIEADAKVSAEKSPTKKVPFLIDGDTTLTDSTSILRYFREKSKQSFLPTCESLDQFCLINTALDTAINLFLMEKAGVDTSSNAYLQRHHSRVGSTLEVLEKMELPTEISNNDVALRLACFLFWGVFRERFSLENYPNLQGFLEKAKTIPHFLSTSP